MQESYITLLNHDSNLYKAVENNIRELGSNELKNGFQESKNALNEFMEYELSKTHMKQFTDLASTKLLKYVKETLDTADHLLLFDFKDLSLENYNKKLKTKMWDRTYPEQRYQLTYDKANLLRRTILIMYCSQFFDDSKKTFRDRFLCSTIASD
ncbi:unnamed protein product [Didymodactylos carnosus]|uniref:Uncharacterized protein n=1 Tax=Didymodactylos carnosus TaxID=1234261 RepID=A0A814DCN9_9BILA|nr:unnamed protein product [Didymodactylos carnosus]CAF3729304.1 unnamed protein product [Didymodactylos carnosus]